MLNLGNASAKDFALGQNLVERIDFGSNVVFDPHTNVVGNLPLAFSSRVTAALKNYRLYGSENGAGVETENKFDYTAKDASNGYGDNVFLRDTGAINSSTNYYISEYIEVSPNAEYTISELIGNTPSICQYDANKEFVSGSAYNSNTTITITTDSSTKYIRLSIRKAREGLVMLVPGTTAPETHIPFGYQLPLTNTSGVTENKFDKDAAYQVSAIANNYTLSGLDPAKSYTCSTTLDKPSGATAASIYFSLTTSATAADNGVWSDKTVTLTPNQDGTILVSTRHTAAGGAPAVSDDVINGTIKIMVNEGSTALPYIPHRYTADYNLYIGSTKLGAEEYLDYESGKVYKRTVQLFNKDAQDTNNGFVEGKYLIQSGTSYAGPGWDISEYIEVEPNTTYTITPKTSSSTPSIVEYDADRNYVVGHRYYGNTTLTITTDATTKYVRASVIKDSLSTILFVEGSTLPETYIPYLQPTDPPAPFPAIAAYKGENTLSSTETVGSVAVKGRIEALYRYLEYITLPDDTGFITDIIPTNLTRSEMDVRFSAERPTNEDANCLWGLMRQPNSQTSSYEYYNMFIARGTFNEATRTVATFYTGQKTVVYSWFNQSSSMANRIEVFDLPTASFITVKMQKGSSAFGAYTCQNNADTTLVNPTVGIGIGGRHAYRDDTQSGILQYCNMGVNKYLYAFRVYDDNDILIHNLLPARRQSDGELGLLDVYTSRFYTNVGAGTITPPPSST